MSQFSIDTFARVHIDNVNIRSEMRGADHVPAMDIAISLTTSNSILSEFDGALKSMLYEAPDQPPAQALVDGVEPISDMPKLRCVVLGPVMIKREYTGYLLTMRPGIIDPQNAIVIGGCDVNKFKVDLLEGGSVKLHMRIQASGIEPGILGKVAALVQQEVEITLEAPSEQQAI